MRHVLTLRSLHWLSLRITDCALALRSRPLFRLGGAIECWVDERMEQALWVQWVRDNGMPTAWVHLPPTDRLYTLDGDMTFVAPREWPATTTAPNTVTPTTRGTSI